MPYDSDFYARYSRYLDEPGVRRVHDFAIRTLTDYSPPERIEVDISWRLKGRFGYQYLKVLQLFVKQFLVHRCRPSPLPLVP